MMITVVDEGTGKGGQVAGYDVAGKTGTAERASESGGYLANNYMSSFLGFAPASAPAAAVYITLDGTPSGSDAAAIPFRTIYVEVRSTRSAYGLRANHSPDVPRRNVWFDVYKG